MKTSSAAANRLPLSRQTAWGYFTTNITLPGFGSLMAGRRSGYFQAALTICGVVLTLIFGVRFMHWALVNWSQLHSPDADPVETLLAMWLAVRWPLLGLALFFIAWLWALGTSLGLLRAAKAAEQAKVPPKLG